MAGQKQLNRNNPFFGIELLSGTHQWSSLFSMRGTFLRLCTCCSTTILNISLCRSIIILRSEEAMKHIRTPLQEELVKERAEPITCKWGKRRQDPCSGKMQWILKRAKMFSSFSCSKKDTDNSLVDLNEYRRKQEPVREGALVHSSDQVSSG